MERSTGFEPVPGPWQGPVLPLYYDRVNRTLPRRLETGQDPHLLPDIAQRAHFTARRNLANYNSLIRWGPLA
jgi:hypothetical protein